MSRIPYPGQSPDRVAAQRGRDAALLRVSRLRRATIIGAGALTAALAAVVSAVAPGRSLGAKASVSARTAVARPTRPQTGSPKMPPLANPSGLGLQAPGAAPQAAPQTQPQPQPQAAPAPTQQSAPVSGGS